MCIIFNVKKTGCIVVSILLLILFSCIKFNDRIDINQILTKKVDATIIKSDTALSLNYCVISKGHETDRIRCIIPIANNSQRDLPNVNICGLTIWGSNDIITSFSYGLLVDGVVRNVDGFLTNNCIAAKDTGYLLYTIPLINNETFGNVKKIVIDSFSYDSIQVTIPLGNIVLKTFSRTQDDDSISCTISNSGSVSITNIVCFDLLMDSNGEPVFWNLSYSSNTQPLMPNETRVLSNANFYQGGSWNTIKCLAVFKEGN